MMNFVQQQEDLYDFDDQSLADELQSGRRGYNQIVVLSEIQRRTKERGEAQKQAMAQQAQQNQPVAERQLMEFMAQAQSAPMPPEGMPPEMAMQGGAGGVPPEMMAAAMPAAMPPEMPAEAPVGITAEMPRRMADGGTVGKAKEFGEAYANRLKQRGIIGLVPGVSGYAEAMRQLMSLRQYFPSTPEATGFGKYFPETDKAGLSLGRVDVMRADPNLDDPESDALDRQYRDFVASQMYAPYHSTSQGFDPTAGGTYDPGSQVNSSISGASSLLPPYGMYKGGSVRRAQAGFRGSYQDPLGQLVGESMTAAGRGTAGVFRGIGAAGMATPGYSQLFSGYGSSPEEERLRRAIAAREQIGLDTSSLKAELNKIIQSRTPAAQRTSTQTGYGSEGVSADEVPSIARRPGTDYSGATTATTDRGVTSLPTYTPSSFDFSSAYERNLGDLQLQPVTIRSPRATEQSVRDASFFAEEMGRLRKFAPDKERFQRESQSDLLVGLGSVIAGATQRGDIAKGLAQLAAQQREARRGFRQEEREYAGLQSALFREERGERRELARERRQEERQERLDDAARRQEARQITVLQMEAQKQIDDANYRMQDLAQRIEIAQAKAEREGMNAQIKLLLDTLNMQLRDEQIKKTRAERLKIEAETAAATRYASTGTSASQVRSATSGGQ